MGLFSEVVADSRPRSGPGAPRTTQPVAQVDQEGSTMISEVEERSTGPRQGADPSSPLIEAAAVSRTAEGSSTVQYRKGKRSTEEGTTDVKGKDFGRSEANLSEQSRQERTTNGLHVDLDAHASEPSFSGQTAVSSGAPFKSEAELSGSLESRRTKTLSNGPHGETDNGTVVPEGSRNPGKAPLSPEPEAVAPSAVKSAEALPPVKQAVAAEGRRERVFETSEAPETTEKNRHESAAAKSPSSILASEPGRPSPPAPLPERERGEARALASSPSVETRERGGDGRAQTPSVTTLPSPAPGEGPGVRAAGHERQPATPAAQPAPVAQAPLVVPVLAPVAPRREPPREPAGPRVQIGRLEVIVTAPAPAAPVAPPAAPSPKPGALASRRYLRSL